MFRRFSQTKHLIPAALLLIILLTVWGCGDSDNILSPIDSDQQVLAAPKSGPKIHQGEGNIDQDGGTVYVTGGTKVIIPEGALDHEVHITVTLEVYKYQEKIHAIFGPYGTFFNVPVRLEMPWSTYLKDYEGPLELWYLEDNGELVLVEDAIIEKNKSRFILYVNHFSEYYYPRR